MSPDVTPWWTTLRLRDEVVAGSGSLEDVQMSLFNAVYGAAGERPRYADPAYYGQITHPSPNLTELMAQVAVRLGGGKRYTSAPSLNRLDQSMGGGKSHALIGLYHLASSPAELAKTDVGKAAFDAARRIAGDDFRPDLANPQVVVMACDNMTVGHPDPHFDGPANTLHERFLWRLFGGDNALYRRYQPFFADKHKLAEALTAVNQPVLILVDEILDYIRQLSISTNADLAITDMAFLRALFDTVNDIPNVAMVVVMIASESDNMDLDLAGRQRRQEIDDLMIRNGKTATVTSNTDFAAILRRRLFESPPPVEVFQATKEKFLSAMKGHWSSRVFSSLPRSSAAEIEQEVARCYPFHPSLVGLAEQEWAPMTGFQKVRSTIRIFAATAYALSQRGQLGEWAPLLIGPGDLPLSIPEVREAVIGSGLIADDRAQANYRQLAATDIVGDDDKSGAARLIDLKRDAALFESVNPRAAERMATALFLFSIVGARSQGRQGATEPELKAATFVPDATYAIPDADSVLAELQDPDRGLAAMELLGGKGGQAPRFFLSTRQTLNMLVRATRASISDVDRDDELARAIERLTNSGPFKAKKFIEVQDEKVDPRPLKEILDTAGIDDARVTRLIALDPRRFSLLNGIDPETRDALEAALGIGQDKLSVAWASSVAFAVVNTQRRRSARAAVTDFVAWSRIQELDSVRLDEDLRQEAIANKSAARTKMDQALKSAFQHVVYLDEAPGGQGRTMKVIRFEHDNHSALDGSVVWARLVEEGKAVGSGEFNAMALLHNLDDKDYGRPLDEVRDSFWNNPRMPLLPDGETDLQKALFAAIGGGQLRLVGDDGDDRLVTSPGEIGVGSATLRLAKPRPVEQAEGTDADAPGVDKPARDVKDGGRDQPQDTPAEVQVGFSINASLRESTKKEAVWRLLSELASRVDDEDASHIQLTVKVVLPKARAQDLVDKASSAGAPVSQTEVSG